MSGEDINDRIAKLIEDWTPEADFVAGIQGEKLAAHLRETDPDLLTEWLDHNAAAFLADQFRWRARRTRARTLRRAAVRAFSDATDAAENGDDEPLSHFAVTYVVSDDGTQRRVGEMTGEDHQFVAAKYQQTASYEAMVAAFHTAVAKKVGKRRTADVLTEEQYDVLFRSVVRRAS